MHVYMMNTTANSSSSITSSYAIPIDQHAALRTSFGFVAFLAFTANGLLVLFLIKNRDLLKTYYSMFILNLAITDTLTGIGIVITPSFIVGNDNFPVPSGFLGELFCRIVASFLLVFTFGVVSIYTIACLAIERWFAVARPTKYKSSFKMRRVKVILLSVWLCALLSTSQSLLQKTLGPNNKCVWIAVFKGNLPQYLAVFNFIIRIFIPLLVMSILFVNLRIRVRKSPALFKTNHGKAGIRILRMCTITAVAFGICWIPNQISYLFFKFGLSKADSPFHHFTMVLCMGNSCLNPFIYCATNRLFRQRFIKFLWPYTEKRLSPVKRMQNNAVAPRHTDNTSGS